MKDDLAAILKLPFLTLPPALERDFGAASTVAHHPQRLLLLHFSLLFVYSALRATRHTLSCNEALLSFRIDCCPASCCVVLRAFNSY